MRTDRECASALKWDHAAFVLDARHVNPWLMSGQVVRGWVLGGTDDR